MILSQFPPDHAPQCAMLLMTAKTYRARPFLAAAERLGVEAVKVVDMPQPLAEFWRNPLGVDFAHPELAVQAIAAYAARNPLGAIISIDDSASEIAAQASAALGLPQNSPEAATAARDKYLMRRLLARGGVPVPHFELHHTDEDIRALAGQVEYPCVVKPLTLNGSRGVIRADDAEQFVAAARRLKALLDSIEPGSESHPFLVESFIPGFEVALEGLLDHGRLKVLALFDKPDPLDGPFFEETIYVTPSRLPMEVQQSIADCASDAARALGLRAGPMHAELRVNDAGPWLVEVAGRSIGGLCSQTLRFAQSADVSLEELILRQALGLDIDSFERERRAGGVMMIPIPRGGLLKRVTGMEAARSVPGIEEIEITAKLNYPIAPLPEGDSYLGFIFARGEEPEEVEAVLREAHARLHFDIQPVILLQIA